MTKYKGAAIERANDFITSHYWSYLSDHDIKIPEYYSVFENDNTQVVYSNPCSKDIKCTVFNKYMCISKNDIEITIHYEIIITFNFTNPCVHTTTSRIKANRIVGVYNKTPVKEKFYDSDCYDDYDGYIKILKCILDYELELSKLIINN